MQTLGERLRLQRMMKNMTQAELAKELDIGTNSVNRYECDARIPKTETLQRLADYYCVSIEELKKE
ncbi:helix-turn-helix transcriptional regulator [Bacillus sp. BGMRC 2118]|nr:helix-turn-helix transcriptional regulator [Bacillus sp. BGMRC 2118]